MPALERECRGMKKIENHCCGCATEAYPCSGSLCPNRRVAVYYCDNCKSQLEDDEIYEVDGEDLCETCLKDLFRKDV
jgi:hypothetical protein